MKRPTARDLGESNRPDPADVARWLSRRTFLERSAQGMGGVALACLLNEQRVLANPPTKPPDPHAFDLRPRQPQFPAQAKAMISLFMQGGPSHVDLLDPKPELTRLDGTNYEASCRI